MILHEQAKIVQICVVELPDVTNGHEIYAIVEKIKNKYNKEGV